MSLFNKPPGQEVAELKERQATCKHNGRFTVRGHNSAWPPCGTCNDCGAEVGMDDIFNTYLRKMDAILDERGLQEK